MFGKVLSALSSLILALFIVFVVYGLMTQCSNVAIYIRDQGGMSCKVH